MKLVLKLVFSIGIIYWLLRTDKLNLDILLQFFSSPTLILAFLLYWLGSTLMLGGIRWMVLARTLGVSIRILQFFKIHLIGCFFNICMPGVVGGDLVKAYYIKESSKNLTLAQGFSTVLLDRICGLIGVFFIATASFFVTPENQSLEYVLKVTQALFVASIGGLLFLFFVVPRYDARKFHRVWQLINKFKLEALYQSLVFYSRSPGPVLIAVALSVFIQFSTVLLFFFITMTMTDEAYFSQVAAAYPLAALVSALPISPAGLGTGHYAYEKLFQITGIGTGIGANVFNLYFCVSICLNMLGVIPYLLYKKNLKQTLNKVSSHAHT